MISYLGIISVINLSLGIQECCCTIRKYLVIRIWIVLVIGSFIEVKLQLNSQCVVANCNHICVMLYVCN
jgi:hypothetical protein